MNLPDEEADNFDVVLFRDAFVGPVNSLDVCLGDTSWDESERILCNRPVMRRVGRDLYICGQIRNSADRSRRKTRRETRR